MAITHDETKDHLSSILKATEILTDLTEMQDVTLDEMLQISKSEEFHRITLWWLVNIAPPPPNLNTAPIWAYSPGPLPKIVMKQPRFHREGTSTSHQQWII